MNHKEHREHKETGPFVIFAFSVVKSFVFQPKNSSVGRQPKTVPRGGNKVNPTLCPLLKGHDRVPELRLILSITQPLQASVAGSEGGEKRMEVSLTKLVENFKARSERNPRTTLSLHRLPDDSRHNTCLLYTSPSPRD